MQSPDSQGDGIWRVKRWRGRGSRDRALVVPSCKQTDNSALSATWQSSRKVAVSHRRGALPRTPPCNHRDHRLLASELPETMVLFKPPPPIWHVLLMAAQQGSPLLVQGSADRLDHLVRKAGSQTSAGLPRPGQRGTGHGADCRACLGPSPEVGLLLMRCDAAGAGGRGAEGCRYRVLAFTGWGG